jgi:RNA polymerase sigma-70 factor (ECF subfamily)
MDDGSVAETAEEFCRQIHPRLVRSLSLFCGDSDLAEDIAQEALARAWDRWRTVSRMHNPTGWVYRVAYNLATSRARRATVERRARRLMAVATPSGADVADAVAVRAAVATLPRRERAAIVLRFFADLSVNDTAAVMRCRPGTVKSLTSHAITKLSHLLSDDQPVSKVPVDA